MTLTRGGFGRPALRVGALAAIVRGMPRPLFVTLTLVTTLASLPGCAFVLGYDQLPQPKAAFRARPDVATAKFAGLVGDARAPGPGERVVTDRNLLGRVARAVNPYGEDVLVVRLELVNASSSLAVVSPSRATLVVDDAAPRPAMGLDDFRKRWPTWAVADAEQTTDREQAIASVLDTLLLDRLLEPGSRTTGRLAFVLPRVRGHLAVVLPVRVADEGGSLSFAWEAL